MGRAAYVVRAYLTLPFHLALLKRETGTGVMVMLRAVVPPFLAALAMTVALLAAMPFLHDGLGHGIAFLAIAVPFGGAVYLAALMVSAPHYVRSNVNVLLPLWKRQRLDTVLQEPY
ncbi:MAG: hypothetical protein WDN69_09370 [Aliidongia sp.]